MKKLIVLVLLFIPFISKSQYADAGVRVSKFNNGIVSKIALGGCGFEDSGPWGLEGFLGRSYIGNWGYLVNVSFFKNLSLTKNVRGPQIYLIGKTGVNIGTYKNFYYINNNYTGFIYYDSKYIQNIGLTAHLGLEWISSDFPISIEATMNPWIDLSNNGPEFIDYNISIKYQFVRIY